MKSVLTYFTGHRWRIMRKLYVWVGILAVVCFVGLVFIVVIDKPAALDGGRWFPHVNSHDGVDFSNLLIKLPDAERVGVKLYDENSWKVYRNYPAGYLEVFLTDSTGTDGYIHLSSGWRRNVYPMLFMSTQGRLFVVGYDLVRNVPSGRTLTVVQPGYDLYEITPQSKGEPRLIAGGIDLESGIDSLVYGRIFEDNITICAEIKCVDVSRGGKVKYWSTSDLRDYEFVEVAFGNEDIYAIVRKKWDDRLNGKINENSAEFFLAKLSSKRASLVPILDDGIPYALSVEGGSPIWKVASSSEGLRTLFAYDIARMRNGGLIDFGDNNLEGRVSWSQVYYLNGLISVASGELAFTDKKIEEYARNRVAAEIELIAQLGNNDFPGYKAKRYSIDREPLLFALHLGRISHLFARAIREKIEAPSLKSALEKIKKELFSLEHTVEGPIDCLLPRHIKCKTLAYRAGYPFWADGVNVPYNYISGYVDGLLSVDEGKQSVGIALNLLRPILVEEKMQELPETWRYWWGQGQMGWSYKTGKSLNTPEWPGNAAGMDLAHISYRSMDASAILKLHDKLKNTSLVKEVAHIRSLVSKGMLYPSVNESFAQRELRADIELTVSKRFSRSAQAGQIHSQVWALSALAKHYK